jgi:ammonium transporter, Amt family
LGIQLVSVLATMVFTFVMTFVILKIVDKAVGLRVSEEEEQKGLDISLHDERGYNA